MSSGDVQNDDEMCSRRREVYEQRPRGRSGSDAC